MQPQVVRPVLAIQVGSRKNFPRDDQHRSGRLHIIYGIISIILGAACVLTKAGGGKYSPINLVCPGVWAGVLNIATGVVAIASTQNEHTGTIAATAILSTLSFLASALFMIFSVFMCMVDRNILKKSPITGFIVLFINIDPDSTDGEVRLRLILDILAICVAICVMFIALIQFLISSWAACCCAGQEKEEEPIAFTTFDGKGTIEEYPPQGQMQTTPHYL